MRARKLVVGLSVAAFGVLGAACVDLFHSTEWKTLCDTSPSDPQCAQDASTPDTSVADGATPPIDFCAWSSEEANRQALRACAWLGACVGAFPEHNLGACALLAEQAYNCHANPDLRPSGELDAMWACLSRVSSCGDVVACAFPAGREECAEAGNGYEQCARANASTLLRCEGDAGPPVAVMPCLLEGRTCSNGAGVEMDSNAYCVGGDGITCFTSTPICRGDHVISCDGAGRDVGIDCSLYGARCTASGGGPTCVPRTPGPSGSCASNGAAPSCVGDVAEACVSGTKVQVDCAAVGRVCTGTPPPGNLAGACTGPTDCSTRVNGCVGGTLQDCAAGHEYSVSCTALGLGPCRSHEVQGKTIAACSPPP
ncbi:MAG: hypothetical protein JWP97_4503 [Labilithrix sp.]|nr:hypothetical protein [Labilithrix sp.]